MTAARILRMALLALAALYVVWFHQDRHLPAAMAVFALPPAVLALWHLRTPALAGFWAGVLALGWFSHAVMVAWSRPGERLPALLAVALALTVVFASSWPGMRRRFRRAG